MCACECCNLYCVTSAGLGIDNYLVQPCSLDCPHEVLVVKGYHKQGTAHNLAPNSLNLIQCSHSREVANDI